MRWMMVLAVAMVAGTAWGQLSPEEIKARMDALNAGAATRPARAVEPIQAKPKLQKKWTAKAGAPELVVRFVDTFEEMRQFEIFVAEQRKVELEKKRAKANAMVIHTRQVRNGFLLEQVADAGDVAARNAALAECNQEAKDIASELRRCREPLYIPHPALNSHRLGDYGYVRGELMVVTSEGPSPAAVPIEFERFIDAVEYDPGAVQVVRDSDAVREIVRGKGAAPLRPRVAMPLPTPTNKPPAGVSGEGR